MSSLCVRIGMEPFLDSCQFISKSEYNKLVKSSELNPVEIEREDYNTHWLISKPDKSEFGMQGNVAFSLAVSAYSRIIMSEVKNNSDIKIYYTDTDSLITETPLPLSMVNSKKN